MRNIAKCQSSFMRISAQMKETFNKQKFLAFLFVRWPASLGYVSRALNICTSEWQKQYIWEKDEDRKKERNSKRLHLPDLLLLFLLHLPPCLQTPESRLYFDGGGSHIGVVEIYVNLFLLRSRFCWLINDFLFRWFNSCVIRLIGADFRFRLCWLDGSAG